MTRSGHLFLSRLLRVLVVAILLAATTSTESPANETHSSSSAVESPHFTQAKQFYRYGQYREALTLLRTLEDQQPRNTEILFLRGLAAASLAQILPADNTEREELLKEAEVVFQAMLVQNPNLLRVRLELAHTYFLKGEDNLAREHFERVLAADPPPPVVANVNRFLGEIRGRRKWSAHFGVALAPDSNIGAESENRIITILGLPFERNQEDLVTSGVGVKVWTGGEYQHPLDDTTRLRFGGDMTRTEYKGNRFDRMELSAHVGPRWLTGPRSELSVLAVARQSWQARDPEHLDLGVRIEAIQRLSDRTSLNIRTSLLRRRHDRDTLLDGPITNLSFGINHVMSPTLRGHLTLGLSRERPESQKNRVIGRRLDVGLQALLAGGLTIGGSAGIRWNDWEGNWYPEVIDGSPREDTTRTLRLSVHHRAFTISGFSPQFSLTREIRTSNSQIHDYKRVASEISFVKPF